MIDARERRLLERTRDTVESIRGNGKKDDDRKERAIALLDEVLTSQPAPPPSNWTREDRAAVTAPPGGFLKRGCMMGGYSADTAYLALGDAERANIRAAWSGHVLPIEIQNSKQLPGGSPVFDLWGNPELVLERLNELVNAGVRPLLFLASDHDARQIGMTNLIDRLRAVWPRYGHLITGVCPRIEMDEDGDRHPQWQAWGQAIRSIIGPEALLWCHFTPDWYYEPKGYDGILYQHKRVGDDGGKRDANEHYFEITRTDEYPPERPQDRGPTASPARSAQRHGWYFVSFEVCQEHDDTEADHDRVIDACLRGLQAIGMPKRWN